MKQIQYIDPEKLVSETNSAFYIIAMTTDTGRLLSWQRRGFAEIFGDRTGSTLFRKDEAPKEYFAALRNARENTTPSFYDSGNLQLIPVPIN